MSPCYEYAEICSSRYSDQGGRYSLSLIFMTQLKMVEMDDDEILSQVNVIDEGRCGVSVCISHWCLAFIKLTIHH